MASTFAEAFASAKTTVTTKKTHNQKRATAKKQQASPIHMACSKAMDMAFMDMKQGGKQFPTERSLLKRARRVLVKDNVFVTPGMEILIGAIIGLKTQRLVDALNGAR